MSRQLFSSFFFCGCLVINIFYNSGFNDRRSFPDPNNYNSRSVNSKSSNHSVNEISRSSFIEELLKCHLNASSQLNWVACSQNQSTSFGNIEFKHILDRDYLILSTPSSCHWLSLVRIYIILNHSFIIAVNPLINPDCLCFSVVYFQEHSLLIIRHLIELE